MARNAAVPAGGVWWGSTAHRDYLIADAGRQLDFFRQSLDPAGGFHAQNLDGSAIPGAPRELHATTRMVHSYAIAGLAGLPGTHDMVDHGMKALWQHHRDTRDGGYLWAFGPDGSVAEGNKLAYGHAFVLLAGASAKMAGHPDADRLIADVMEVIDAHFWDHSLGRMREEFTRDWQSFSTYRGMNANMHMSEALLTATEATGDTSYAERARGIFDFFVGQMATQHDWRLPEHYTLEWQVDPEYRGNPMFRPQGATPGHAFEFSRLMLQLWDLTGRRDDVLPARAQALYARALAEGWQATEGPAGGGFNYTVDLDNGQPLVRARYWWPVTEAIGTAASLIKSGLPGDYEADYLRFWQVADQLFIDHDHGGWIPEVDAVGKPDGRQFIGKPDIYHSVQACLYPLMPGLSGFAAGLAAIKA